MGNAFDTENDLRAFFVLCQYGVEGKENIAGGRDVNVFQFSAYRRPRCVFLLVQGIFKCYALKTVK